MKSNSDNKPEVFQGWRGPHLSVFFPREVSVNPFIFLRKAQMEIVASPKKRVEAVRALLCGVLMEYDRWARGCFENPCGVESLVQSTRIKVEKMKDSREALGIEGYFHREVFKYWEREFSSVYGFNGRNRRPPEDPVNAMISYGNSIVYGLCVPPLQKAGFNTSLGILHEPGRGRNTLALDMAELIKPFLVEFPVWAILKEEKLEAGMYAFSTSGCLLEVEGRKLLKEKMSESADKLFGDSSSKKYGWPQKLLDLFDYFALEWSKDFLRGTFPKYWSLTRRGG
jgi:CRISPR-associated protein Cas1